MVDINNNDRLIGDFLEINSNIVQFQESNSKIPKFLRKFWAKNKRKKLLKIAKKLRNSNYILTSQNLSELFVYVYNNFPPRGNYNSIFMSKVNTETNDVEAIITFDSCRAVITIEESISGFDISISEKKSDYYNESCSIHCESLYHDSARSDILEKINKQLLSDLTDYIIDIISSYN